MSQTWTLAFAIAFVVALPALFVLKRFHWLESEWFSVVLPAGAFLLAFLVIWIGLSRARARRRNAMEACAKRMGLSFDTDGDDFDLDPLSDLPMFAEPPGRYDTRDARNVMTGHRSGLDMAVLDYTYWDFTTSVKGTDMNTVACFRSDALRLPTFQLTALKGRLARGAARIARTRRLRVRVVTLDGNPRFAEAYLLCGDDAQALRSLFTPSVMDFFVQHAGLFVQGSGQCLAVFRPLREFGLGGALGTWNLTKPEAIPALVEEGVAVAALFDKQHR